MKKIINCFNDESSSGLGDFLRGSAYMYQTCKEKNINFDIDFSNHKLNKFLKSRNTHKVKNSEIINLSEKIKREKKHFDGTNDFFAEMESQLLEIINNVKHNETKHICTNYSNLMKIKEDYVSTEINNSIQITKECSSWLKENLVFAPYVDSLASIELCRNNLQEKRYHLMHFRLGDEISFLGLSLIGKNMNFEDYFEICKKTSEELNMPILVISDSNKLKNKIKEMSEKEGLDIKVATTFSSHTQKKPSKRATKNLHVEDVGLLGAAVDSKLISLSASVYSYSVYFWGSGFATWISQIYGVPIKIHQL